MYIHEQEYLPITSFINDDPAATKASRLIIKIYKSHRNVKEDEDLLRTMDVPIHS